MKIQLSKTLLPALLALSSASAYAETGSGQWYLRPYVGISQMSDLSADFEDIDGRSGDADIDLDSGFAGGLGIGYWLNERVALEFGWEYRSNDSSVTLAGESEFDDGNYASNLFYLNGAYHFDQQGQWRPYVGGGLTWIEEIDIDLEGGDEDLSYSGDGDTGYQVFAGVNYAIDANWTLQTELRYGSISGIDLDGESGAAGKLTDLDYETTTLQLGVLYQF